MRILITFITLVLFCIEAYSNDNITLMLYNGFYVRVNETGDFIESTQKDLGVPLVDFRFTNDDIRIKINTPPTTTIQEFLIKPHIASYVETDKGFELLFAELESGGLYKLICEIDGDMEMLGISRLNIETQYQEALMLMYNNRDDILRLLDANVPCIYDSLSKIKRILGKYKWNGR